MKITKTIAKKVLQTVDAGLCHGVGSPIPGQMCVEAAVCFAMGLPHGDQPTCVGKAVRSFKISLNDRAWSSDQARAKGLRKLAIAQLGSDTIDQVAFVHNLSVKICQKVVPIALRAAAKVAKQDSHKTALEASAKRCESAQTREQAREFCLEANKIAKSAAAAYAAYAAYAAAAYAAYAAAAYAAAAYADAYADAYAAAYAAAYADAYADAAAYAYAAADAAAADKSRRRDEILTLAADLALEVLIEMKAPGCKWLTLCTNQ